MDEPPVSFERLSKSQGDAWDEGRRRAGPPPRIAALIDRKKSASAAEQKAAERRAKDMIREDAIVRELSSGARTIERLKDAVNGKTGFVAKKDHLQNELADRVQGLQSASSFREIRCGLEQEVLEREASAKKRKKGSKVKTSKLSFGEGADGESFSDDDLDAQAL